VHNWSYDPSYYFSEDDTVMYVSRFCMLCGAREVGEVAWRRPDADELRLILAEAARRDANPRAELDAEYERGFLECGNQVKRALHAITQPGDRPLDD
jgi:hypothetical protein